MCFTSTVPIKHLDIRVTGKPGTRERLGPPVALNRDKMRCMRLLVTTKYYLRLIYQLEDPPSEAGPHAPERHTT